jgi:hypothetical protein
MWRNYRRLWGEEVRFKDVKERSLIRGELKAILNLSGNPNDSVNYPKSRDI